MPSYDISYTYDAVGNRLTQTDNLTSGVTTYTYDAANRLLTEVDSGGTTTYSYDADGNRTKKEAPSATTFYSWNEDNRMIEAEPPSGKVTMTYDADGKRLKKETPTDTKKYIYDFERLLQETDGNDDTNVLYTATLEEYGDLVSEFDGSASSYHQYDALGSTDALLDDGETVTDRYRYRAFGLEEHQSGSSSSPFTFVGRQNYYRDSELDLYLAGLRHYDPAIGQWVSDDPIGFEAGDVNLRRYVANNAVLHSDPSGLLSQEEIEQLAEGLGSDSYAEREKAARDLRDAVKTIDDVNAVGRHFDTHDPDDLEVAYRATAALAVKIASLVLTKPTVCGLTVPELTGGAADRTAVELAVEELVKQLEASLDRAKISSDFSREAAKRALKRRITDIAHRNPFFLDLFEFMNACDTGEKVTVSFVLVPSDDETPMKLRVIFTRANKDAITLTY